MFQQWKLISQKTNLKYFIIIGSVSLFALILVLNSDDSCGVSHIQIISQINSYEKTLDPEFCEEIVERIDTFNEICEPKIEILDCG
ncbi:hypothetical protein [Nitrosopumilus sp.]|uniref:hypothetical protein n=1 Tax=Nitrosopumilus sp. TaxID=2024843 RepID=UPI00261FBF5F|nr:hypothetical protein [Nitrosopumilus sp.]